MMKAQQTKAEFNERLSAVARGLDPDKVKDASIYVPKAPAKSGTAKKIASLNWSPLATPETILMKQRDDLLAALVRIATWPASAAELREMARAAIERYDTGAVKARAK
jgi:hypothetical protein